MMEIEQFSYIFGSFSRRKQADFNSGTSSKRRSVETSNPSTPLAKPTSLAISHDRSKSFPEKSPTNAVQKLKCPLCEKYFIEPRVLPCLHTFCSTCINELMTRSLSSSSDCDSSSGSGYVSEKLDNIDVCPPRTGQWLQCPICALRTRIPEDGVQGFPINYLILHKIVLATLNSPSTKLLCDACPSEVIAKTRCTQCAISLCRQCADTHRKQKPGSHHEILELDEARRRGITNVRRQVMCQKHPECELSTFCATCSQVLCSDCILAHRNHNLESASKASKSQLTNIRIAVNRTKSVAEKSLLASNQLETTAERIENQCNQIENEIDRFTANYIRAVEEHRTQLFKQLRQARREKLDTVDSHRTQLQKRFRDAEEVIRFANELLRDGSEVEVLSFMAPLLKRLEVCYKADTLLPELKISESLQFLPEEVSTTVGENACCPLYGVITTQTISVRHCFLHTEGLQNLRVGRRAEAILETRDRSDNSLQRGGENVTAELRHRDGGTSRTIPVRVEDKRDGSYLLQFVPDVAGKLFLHVHIKGEPLKDSPFTILVKSLRPHHGTFHCCTFCSSGGSKEATCGCKGNMPGGYKGCGHGHDGHPGRRHWSCCGNVLEHSECVRTNSITHYQFTL